VDEVILPTYYRRGHRVFLIQDNASYHTHPEVATWFEQARRRLVVFGLPKYSPELHAQERLWRYTRREATHNRYFATPADLCASLFTTFADMQRHPENIAELLQSFS
jgi:transposase